MTTFNQLALLVPLGWAITAILIKFSSLTTTFRITRAMAYSGFAIALLMILSLVFEGAATTPVIGWQGLGLSARIDALSVTIFTLVSFIAILVLRYSENYLDGDPRHLSFMSRMCLTLGATSLLVISGNLFQLVFAWIATSLALHTLLLFYHERPGAIIAAKKKWLTARVGDVLLIAAAFFLYDEFGTADIAAMLQAAGQMTTFTASAQIACVFIALAALLKSAQFPSHGWLLEVMETPTPVSALLHAGIINAGGFLILRFADVMLLNPAAMHLVAIVGGFTALFAGFVMLTQPAVKTALAWSTIAQMGFMMLQCGLGAFPIAVLHLVAHSLYKAHAFLSSGSIIDIAKSSRVPKVAQEGWQLRMLMAVGMSLALYVSTTYAFFSEHMFTPINLTLGMILVMGLTHLILKSLDESLGSYSMTKTFTTALALSLAFNVLHFGSIKVFGGMFPEPPTAGLWEYLVIALTLASFTLVMCLQIMAPGWMGTKRWSKLYVHLQNGFYLNAYFDRLVGTYRLPANRITNS